MITSYSWILDSGGAGRGAWQGGVIYEFMKWCRESGRLPSVTMGASAGGYAAADVATGAEQTVMKGWTRWGLEKLPSQLNRFGGIGNFRFHLCASIRYVMDKDELAGIFQSDLQKKLLVFTTRVRRRDMKPFKSIDSLRYFFKSATRKLPKALKYLPDSYYEDPVLFASHLPVELHSEHVRPLSLKNFNSVIEASCLVPFAMGSPLLPESLEGAENSCPAHIYEGDRHAAFIDGGYAFKMPMGLFEEDSNFQQLAEWTRTDKTLVFCCDPTGQLWETSSRLRSLNTLPGVIKALREDRMIIISPDHKVEAGFLCTDNDIIMRTFRRGQEQARRLLESERFMKFFEM
jgi:hypothetical protein